MKSGRITSILMTNKKECHLEKSLWRGKKKKKNTRSKVLLMKKKGLKSIEIKTKAINFLSD